MLRGKMDRHVFLRHAWRTAAIVVCVIALAGCAFLEELDLLPDPLVQATPTQTPTLAVTSTQTATPEAATPAVSPRVVTLEMWVPELVSSLDGGGGADVLVNQLTAFFAETSGAQVRVTVKKDSGSGGIYNLLSTAHEVAPSIMPDVIVLNQHDLLVAGEGGLIRPLQGNIPDESAYVATSLASVRNGDTIWAFPYLARASQMAYRSAISTTPPLSWTTILTESVAMLFPAAPVDGLATDTLLAIYVGSGGRVTDASGQATLDRAALERVYGFFAEMQQGDLLDVEQALAMSDAASCWRAYQEGIGQLTPVPVSQYWLEPLEDTLPGWAPTQEGQPITILSTWGLAIVTEDPVRGAAALELIRWLVSAENMAELAAATQMLPTRTQALGSWSVVADGEAFVGQLLDSSVRALPPSVDTPVRRALQAGLTALLLQEVDSPEAAASTALTNLRR